MTTRTNVVAHPAAGPVARVQTLYELADEADRIRTKFKGILDEMNAETARADAMLAEIEDAI